MTGLQVFANNVWIADGPLVLDMGLTFTTRMTIVKLSDGSLWISSPVPVPFDTLQAIRELGPVRYLVAATPRHVWRLPQWQGLFPDAELCACRPTLVTLKKRGLPPTGVLGDSPPQAWAEDFDQMVFKGNPLLSEVLFFHKKTHTLMLDDLIQCNPILEDRPFRNAIFKIFGGLYPKSGVGLDMRLTFIHRDLARQSLREVLAWDFDKLIIAHGACINKDAKPYVEEAFQWLVH